MKMIGSGFLENFKMAMSTLASNKLRSFLTIFGVIIGIVCVMLLGSIMSGIDTALTKEIQSFGTNSIFLYKFDIGFTGPPTREC
jgi:putative ABC transport system permease protein